MIDNLKAILAVSALGLPLIVAGSGPARAADEAAVQVSQKEPYGQYLTDSKGMSLYLFEADSDMKSACYDACAKAWPPLTVEGEPSVGKKLEPGKLATIKRDDGSTQVTYGGWPLYYFIKDQEAGDTEGQDVEGFGAEWYLVSPEGEEVEE
jgi:predicted lipoprotein with Yx(FWY)xxD motif